MEFRTKREAEEAKSAAARGARAAGRLYEKLTSPSAQRIATAHHERADRLEAEAARIRALLPTLEE